MFLLYILLFVAAAYGFIWILHFTVQSFKFHFNEEHIDMFFGLPGSGKTTVLAEIVRQTLSDRKHKTSVFCNMPIRGSYIVERSDIGKYDFRVDGADSALLLLDEGQTVYNCRNAMSKKESLRISDTETQFFCMHRHYKTMLCCFSQGFEDMDKIIRNRTTKLYYVEKSRIRPFIRIRTIVKMIHIDDLQKQIMEGFEFEKFSTRYVYGKRVWRMFDTYDAEPLPAKDPTRWYVETKV